MREKSWQKFIQITSGLSPEELKLWMEVMLTPAEQEDIADRIRILEGLLTEEVPQRDLSAKINVSISKITRGSNALKRLGAQKQAWLKRLIS